MFRPQKSGLDQLTDFTQSYDADNSWLYGTSEVLFLCTSQDRTNKTFYFIKRI